MSRVAGQLRRLRAAMGTIRVRLTLSYVGLLALILGGFSAFVYLNVSRSLRADLDLVLEAQAEQVGAAIDVIGDRPELGDAPDQLVTGTVAVLYDRDGRQIAASDPRGPLPQLRPTQGPSLESVEAPTGEDWRVLTRPILASGRVVGVLQVARSERDVEIALRELLSVIALAVPLALLVAVAGGLFLASRALNPIDRVTRAAAQIGAEDLSRRLNLPPTSDEVGRLAATFDGMLDRLDRAFRRQRQFTADASHELRTPLAMLVSQADVVLARTRTAAEYRRTLASIREDAARMAHLLGEMLTLARADAGQDQLTREPLSLDEVAGDVVAAMEPLARTRGVDLASSSMEPVPIEGDQTRLTQLLVNLVDNAVKYTPAGGTVTVSVEREAGQAVVRVVDTGIGIAPDELPNLFERFYRVDTARSRAEGGAGLGLAIGAWIARAHGGEIRVASELDRGSTFTVRLPLRPSDAPRVRHRQGGADDQTDTPDGLGEPRTAR